MQTETQINLIRLCDLYASKRGVTHWRVSRLAHGDGQFFKRQKDNKGLTLRVAAKVLQWFSDNWPADLEWPADIPRPEMTTDAKGAP